MTIVLISAGAAGRYCGTCLHDNTLATALVAAGEDVLLMPTYTPLRTDEANVSQSRIFFGGVNVYLQQRSALFRYTPWFLDRLLDSPRLLHWLSKRSSGMEVRELGALTVSTLQGEDGHQRKELAKLVHWLQRQVKPRLVHLTNSMLVGMARPLRQELNVPIVCSLSGEDIFLEQLTEPHYSQARQLLRDGCRHVDAFIALNHYFADYMAEYLEVDRAKIHVIRHGVNLEGHRPPCDEAELKPAAAGDAAKPNKVVIGYFARVAAEKGLHVLVDAFLLLLEDRSLPPLRLRVAGYMSESDKAYFEAIRKRVEAANANDRFEYVGEVDRQGKLRFLQSIDVMSVPTVYRESKGISVLEGMANGIPMVLPAHGTFPELIEDTGGGVLCEPENPRSLADALRQLILDPALRCRLARAAHQAIHTRYTAPKMAEETRALYRALMK